jgi:transcription elongation factor GreA
MKRTPMTAGGAERLRAELERLKSQDRPRVIQAIAEARAHGDLRENAEYHAAREQQGFIEGRIKELDAALSYAEVIDVARLNAGARIVFGATVDLADEDSGDEVTYQIVGDLEADIKRKLISVSSPLARALIGKSEGDSFDFIAANGTKRYEIVAVRYVVA